MPVTRLYSRRMYPSDGAKKRAPEKKSVLFSFLPNLTTSNPLVAYYHAHSFYNRQLGFTASAQSHKHAAARTRIRAERRKGDEKKTIQVQIWRSTTRNVESTSAGIPDAFNLNHFKAAPEHYVQILLPFTCAQLLPVVRPSTEQPFIHSTNENLKKKPTPCTSLPLSIRFTFSSSGKTCRQLGYSHLRSTNRPAHPQEAQTPSHTAQTTYTTRHGKKINRANSRKKKSQNHDRDFVAEEKVEVDWLRCE